jgi:hypothetical protein
MVVKMAMGVREHQVKSIATEGREGALVCGGQAKRRRILRNRTGEMKIQSQGFVDSKGFAERTGALPFEAMRTDERFRASKPRWAGAKTWWILQNGLLNEANLRDYWN